MVVNQLYLVCVGVQIVSADGSTMKARALLNLASYTSLIMESLAQCLCLRCRHHFMKVSGISSYTARLFSRGMVHLNISSHEEKSLALEAIELLKVATDLPSCLVPFSQKWKHLSNICLTDPDFGTPGSTDVLLGANVFSSTILHDWWFGHLGSPFAFKTYFA